MGRADTCKLAKRPNGSKKRTGGSMACCTTGSPPSSPPRSRDDPTTRRVKKATKHQHIHIGFAPHMNTKISYRDLILGKKFGKGAQGVVRMAKHKVAGNLFALKLISLESANKAEMQAELEKIKKMAYNEQLARTKLRRFTVESYEIYYVETDRKFCILMELMSHGSLTDCLRKLHGTSYMKSLPSPPSTKPIGSEFGTVGFNPNRSRFSMEDVSHIAFAVLNGLAHLQSLRLIHNDIKPGNILVSRDGSVKIGDFGVARWTDTMSLVGTGTGSIGYMAPERVKGEDYTYQADIFSLGLTIAYCTFGTYPLVGPSEFGVLEEVANGRAEVTYPSIDGIDPDIQDITAKCLTSVWRNRPSAEELLKHKFITKYHRDEKTLPGFVRSLNNMEAQHFEDRLPSNETASSPGSCFSLGAQTRQYRALNLNSRDGELPI
eukprot:TRINITY_DN5809_c3_g1_i1.p1 TRINITY_DN5809_c3_g1~~TRINITY_DN5809_c3_g1_i1.p1  ORF type:complete len:479 (+),score=58.55 TRINITY_DN5809_c3_g1_i1:136-1437(+)